MRARTTRNLSLNAPQWSLSDLFQGPKDARIEKRMNAISAEAVLFSKKLKGKLRKMAGEKPLYKALRQYEYLLQESWKIYLFASLRHAECSLQPERGAFLQRCRYFQQAIERELLFFKLELEALGERKLQLLSKKRMFKPYAHFLNRVSDWRPHRLSETEEKLLLEKNLTGRQALLRLYQENMARKKFYLSGKRKEQQALMQSEILSLLYHELRSERRKAALSFSAGLAEESQLNTYLINMLLEDKALEDRKRGFKSPEHARHLANEIGQDLVDVMVGSVAQYFWMVRSYYRLKARLLKSRTLYDYDRYAPVNAGKISKSPSYSFSEARRLVLNAFSEFSIEFSKVAEEFFNKRWIDAALREGKRAGAFCSFGTPDTHPYVFLNFTGSRQDLFTLAHELGHGIHAGLMRTQSYLNFEVPLTVAETASVFAEMLLFQHLKKQVKERAGRINLLCATIENIIATVFRQISIYRFEQDLHACRCSEGELSVSKINQLWRSQQERLFGSSVTLSKGYEAWWAAVHHIYHTPFYVYAYSFGELLSLSLFARYQQACLEGLGDKFCNRYLELLKAGGSLAPRELFKPFGIDLDDKAFWKSGLEYVHSLLTELEDLC